MTDSYHWLRLVRSDKYCDYYEFTEEAASRIRVIVKYICCIGFVISVIGLLIETGII